jgi:ubiquinone/menaquinone biosynthesis C-methylase UbiE
MLRRIVRVLKKIPFDLGQYELRHRTKGKKIAFDLVGPGEGKKALDVGCREGYWTEKLKRKGYQVVAIDIEPHYSEGLAVDANQALPFAESEFDLVWCSEVIEHLSNPAFTIAEFKRVLKPGGSLVMTTPNQKFWIFRLVEALGISMQRLENETHTYFFSYSDIQALAGDGDFYGYFPYLLLKMRISAAAPLLSPTIVSRHLNDKRQTAPATSAGSQSQAAVGTQLEADAR